MKKDKTPLLLRVVRWVFPKLERWAPSLANRYFVKIFFTPLKYRMPDKEREVQQKAEKFHVMVGAKKIQCYRWGSGPFVLVVHGWAGRPTQFRKFIEPLKQSGYGVVGFDGPAHGNSDGKSTDIFEFERCLNALYEKVGVPEAVICHSFGGAAVLFAAMNGLPVKGLINIASPTIGDEIINTYLRAINGSAATGEYFKSYIIKRSGRPFDEYTSLYFVRHLKEKIPVLLVHDSGDKDVFIRHAHALIQVYPEARLYQTEGLGHTRILRDEAVIRECVTFISGLRLNTPAGELPPKA